MPSSSKNAPSPPPAGPGRAADPASRRVVAGLTRRLILALEAPRRLPFIDASRHRRFDRSEHLPGEYEHAHTYHELVYVAEGQMILTLNGQAARFAAPCVVILPPGVRHHERPVRSGAPYRALGCVLQHTGTLWVSYRKRGSGQAGYRTTQFFRFPFTLDDFGADWRDLYARDPIDRAFLRNRFQNFLIALWRQLARPPREPAVAADTPAALAAALEQAELFIRNEYARGISLSDVAAHVGYSTDHLSRTWRRAHGRSPLALIQELRLEQARDQLIHSTAKVTELARNAGFDNANYFISVFKKRYGVTPAAFRERQVG